MICLPLENSIISNFNPIRKFTPGETGAYPGVHQQVDPPVWDHPENGVRFEDRRHMCIHRSPVGKHESEADMSSNVLSFGWEATYLFWTKSRLWGELETGLVLNRYGITSPYIRVQRLWEQSQT